MKEEIIEFNIGDRVKLTRPNNEIEIELTRKGYKEFIITRTDGYKGAVVVALEGQTLKAWHIRPESLDLIKE